MNSLNVLEIKSNYAGRSSTIFPVVLCEGKELILVDTGFPGLFELIKSAAAGKGINLENLTKIVITHHDIDHIGCLAEMKRTFKNVKVLSSVIEADYISGEKTSLRLENAKKIFDKLSEEQKQGSLNFQKLFENLERTNVDIVLNDNDLIPGCSRLRVITTPGHLPGHMSVYAEETKTFIAGDAVGFMDNKFLFNPNFTTDKNQAKESLRKVLKYDIQNIVCYHGGVFEGDCKKALQDLLQSEN